MSFVVKISINNNSSQTTYLKYYTLYAIRNEHGIVFTPTKTKDNEKVLLAYFYCPGAECKILRFIY
jgi:hypothetical protein